MIRLTSLNQIKLIRLASLAQMSRDSGSNESLPARKYNLMNKRRGKMVDVKLRATCDYLTIKPVILASRQCITSLVILPAKKANLGK